MEEMFKLIELIASEHNIFFCNKCLKYRKFTDITYKENKERTIQCTICKNNKVILNELEII